MDVRNLNSLKKADLLKIIATLKKDELIKIINSKKIQNGGWTGDYSTKENINPSKKIYNKIPNALKNNAIYADPSLNA